MLISIFGVVGLKYLKYILFVSGITAALGFLYGPVSPVSLNPAILKNVNLIDKSSHVLNPKREFRSAWITTFTNLDWPSRRGLSSEEQQKEFIKTLDNLSKNGINSVIVQVRASSDAFYKSEYSPWSEWLSGKQGQAPSPYYDPLTFMVQECHKRNMEFHAWFNPFRAVSHTRFSSVAKDHITKKQPHWFFKYGDSKYYNPGIPEVRSYIQRVVMEVVDNYDIDGVHFDDYFYPYTINNQPIPDQTAYKTFGGDFSNIEDWRRYNINQLIKEIGAAIKKKKSYVKFGVSPLAIWRNKKQDPEGSATNSSHTSFDNLYCDTRLWIEKGWVDYLAPQCYWSTKNRFANYNSLLDWWSYVNKEKHLYIGHAAYKLNKKVRHHYEKEELLNQIQLSREKTNVQGSIYFRAKAFNENHQNFTDTLKSGVYKYPALIPTMSWLDSIPPAQPRNLAIKNKENGLLLKWKKPISKTEQDTAYYYVLYRFKKDTPYDLGISNGIIGITKERSFVDLTAKEGQRYVYYVRSADRLHNESELFAMKSIKRIKP